MRYCKALRAFFVFAQISLTIYFIWYSIDNWEQTPSVTSGTSTLKVTVSFEKRQCLIPEGMENYTRIECLVKQVHDYATSKCQCLHILMGGLVVNQSNNETLAPEWSRNNKISARSDRKRDQ